MTSHRFFALALAGLALVATASAQNLVSNHSFETPTLTPGGYQPYTAGQTIGAWTVTGNGVLQIETSYGEPSNGITAFNAQDGNIALDLSGFGNSGLSGVQQTLATVVGQTYNLSFYVGTADSTGVTSYFTAPSAVELVLDGVSVGTFVNATMTPGYVNWAQFTTTFTATSASTVLAFNNAIFTGDNNYVGLDNVSVTPVPEPASMAVLGIGLAALRRRRARK